MSDQSLPLRLGVGIIVLNQKNLVFVGKRNDNPSDKWQMPQGGVNKNEELIQAARRELFEETSIRNINIIKEIKEWQYYNLPKNLIGIIWKGRFRGQKQKWFIVRFEGSDNEINLNTKFPEFIDWKWISPEKLPDVIVDFKRDLYINLLKEIKDFI